MSEKRSRFVPVISNTFGSDLKEQVDSFDFQSDQFPFVFIKFPPPLVEKRHYLLNLFPRGYYILVRT